MKKPSLVTSLPLSTPNAHTPSSVTAQESQTAASDAICPFERAVRIELRRARRLHPHPLHSFHEGLAVLLEETHEVQTEIFRKDGVRRHDLILAECVQIAAMAQRLCEDLRLIEE